MKSSFDQYERVARSTLGMSSLWVGDDHLVYVKGTGFVQSFTEEYRRYRYQDIQSFTIVPTNRALAFVLWGLAFLFFAGIVAGVFLARDSLDLSAVILLAMTLPVAGAIFSIAILIRHWVLGPSCYCEIQTSLRRDRLLPLKRKFPTREAVRIIGEKIEKSQADLLGAAGSAVRTQEAKVESAIPFQIPRLVMPNLIGFALFSLVALGTLHLESSALAGASMLVLLGSGILLLATLVQVMKKNCPRSIRGCLWTLLGASLLLVFVSFFYFMYALTVNPVYSIDFSGPFDAFASINQEGGLAFYLIFLVNLLVISAATFLGVYFVMTWGRRIAEVARLGAELDRDIA